MFRSWVQVPLEEPRTADLNWQIALLRLPPTSPKEQLGLASVAERRSLRFDPYRSVGNGLRPAEGYAPQLGIIFNYITNYFSVLYFRLLCISGGAAGSTQCSPILRLLRIEDPKSNQRFDLAPSG